MKTPITYYGGKITMLPHILPMIPAHEIYTEAFFGGGAVYFAKEPAKVEVVNDLNSELVNLYQVIKNDFKALKRMVELTPYSREIHRKAGFIRDHPSVFNHIERAWAVYICMAQGFSSKLDGSWGYGLSRSESKGFISKQKLFNEELVERLRNTDIECNNALKVISSRDSDKTFHYVDPPYFNSNCGHYAGYTEADFRMLLELLATVKGKFLLSSYPSDVLQEFIDKNDWNVHQIEKNIAISGKTNKGKRKIEVLTYNYTMPYVA